MSSMRYEKPTTSTSSNELGTRYSHPKKPGRATPLASVIRRNIAKPQISTDALDPCGVSVLQEHFHKMVRASYAES